MAMKGHFTIPKVLGLEPQHQMQLRVITRIHIGREVLSLRRDAVSVLYRPSLKKSYIIMMIITAVIKKL